MENSYKNICVFCASSANIDLKYILAAYNLGGLLAANGITCICGAGRTGLMRALTDGALDKGGAVTGIIPQFMVDNGWAYHRLTSTIVTEDMHHRKQKMATLADAVIALPGGCGTLEELLEIITWKQLGLYKSPIIILNVDGFFNPLLEMFRKCIDQHFMKQSHSALWHVASSPQEALGLLSTIDREKEESVESKY